MTRLMVTGLATLLVGLAGLATAQVPNFKGPYDHVRADLLKAGYHPAALHHDADDLFCSKGFCNKYPEVADCAGTGVNPCVFVFTKPARGKYIVVLTTGESKLTVTGIRDANSVDLATIRQRQ